MGNRIYKRKGPWVMGPVPLEDRICEKPVTWRIGSASIYKKPVTGEWDRIHKQPVTPWIGSTGS